MNKPLLVDIYCRVSTERQEDNTSLEEQERSCHEFCAKNGLIVAKVHKEVFSSHVYRERKVLTLMRERYLSGQIQGVVVRTFDRLSRREVHMGVLLEEMEHHGIKLWASTEELDDSKIGRTTRMFLSMLAEWEWEKIHERVTTGRINAAKNGKVVAGKKPPYGWRWEYDDKGNKVRIVHHDSQIWVIRWMAIQYARGLSTMEISRQLTARDIPTPGDSQRDGKWQPIMIRRILTKNA